MKRAPFWEDMVSQRFLPKVRGHSKPVTKWSRTAVRSCPNGRLLLCAAVMLLCLVSLSLLACSREDNNEKPRAPPTPGTHQPTQGGVYSRPLANDPSSLDPAQIADIYAVAVANQIFDGLVEFDVHLNILPALAQSWSASRDGLVWTFNLRKGVQFHNGREMKADDVVYSFSRFIDPAVGSRRSWFLDKVKGAAEFRKGQSKTLEGIKAVDHYSVEITLSEPFAPFVSLLGLPHLSIIPREAVEQLGTDFATAPMGTGAFRFMHWIRGREIVLEANPHYFRGRPALDRIRFVIFPGGVFDEMLADFERGELEESPIPPERRSELFKTTTYKVIRKPLLSIRFLGFNFELPPFHRVEVRRAFNYAVDKVRLNQEVQGDRYVVARGILPPGIPGYNPEIQGYDYNPQMAKHLLTRAGFPGGQGLAPVTLSSAVKSDEIRNESKTVQHYLADIGVQVELQDFDDWPTFQRALQQGQLQLFRYGWYADYPDPDNFLYFLFHSRSKDNYFHYHNAQVDQLLEEGRRETDELHRVKLYRKAEQLILNDAPGIILLHHVYEGLYQPYVKGVEVSALGEWYIPMRKIHLDRNGPPSAMK
jgi:oligopeptide transport system substrate-binding protein